MSDEIKIEKGIPIPERNSKYPAMKMEIGDSIFVPGKTSGSLGGHFATFRPRRFKMRKEGDGTRVWRIA